MRFALFFAVLFSVACMLPLAAQVPVEEKSRISSNAAGGLYNSDQRFWFSVEDGRRLILFLDGKEVYQGFGPASLLLGADEGVFKQYALSAECWSTDPEAVLLESTSFVIGIDKQKPNPPSFKTVHSEDDSWSLLASFDPDVRLDACIDTGNGSEYFSGLDPVLPLPDASASFIAWTVDQAGNSSEPVKLNLQPIEMQVHNPVPGTWANPQHLVVSTRGEGVLYWALGAVDPLVDGQVYTGPLEIPDRGRVQLKLAYKGRDGRVLSREIEYTVLEDRYEIEQDLAHLDAAQNSVVQETLSLGIPDAFLWSMGSVPDQKGGTDVVLRPVNGINRAVALHAGQDFKVYRYVYSLDTVEPGKTPASVLKDPETIRQGDVSIHTANTVRVLFWPAKPGFIHYRMANDSSWIRAKGPLPLPEEAVTLEWMIDNGSFSEGPFTVQLPPVPDTSMTGPVREGRVSYRNYAGKETENRTAWTPVLHHSVDASFEHLALDVCDGEDIQWRFISFADGQEFFRRKDRLVPAVPVLDAPEPDSWVSAPVSIQVHSQSGNAEEQANAIIKLIDNSGTETIKQTQDSLELDIKEGGPYTVHITAFCEDPAGNISAPVYRSFILDSQTVYVSSSMDAAASMSTTADGSRLNPFHRLEDAIAMAREDERSVIRISGSHVLDKGLEIGSDIRIEGRFDKDWNSSGAHARLFMEKDAFFKVDGASLTLAGIQVDAQGSDVPLVQLESGSALELDDCILTADSSIVAARQSDIVINKSLLRSDSASRSRLPVFDVAGGRLSMSESRVEFNAEHALALDVFSVDLTLSDSVILGSGSKTCLGIRMADSKIEFDRVHLESVADSYASAFEQRNSHAEFNSCALSLKARDVSAVLVEGGSAVFTGMNIKLDSDFVCRVMEFKQLSPQIHDSVFESCGRARNSELFSGSPDFGASSITGNLFNGFTVIFAPRYTIDRIVSFNRAYGNVQKPNRDITE